ncbi:MAG: squalene--hopene cyclase [Gemmatales bacterium]|nr:MAG: squalene--hopene cyclase [Gemmatales bacterium]
MPPVDRQRLENAYDRAFEELLAWRKEAGYWTGELSTSALSTATAVSALHLCSLEPCFQQHRPQFEALVENGLRWLAEHQNEDGGWGDTTKSISNISTSMLVKAAFCLTGGSRFADVANRLEHYLRKHCGQTVQQQAEAIRSRYGKDRTFAVPILMNCALAGFLPWREVTPLPFELACFPQSWYRFFRLPVVSYALPALIAVGQVIFHHRPPNFAWRMVRRMAVPPSLRVLQNIQPSSGGFLEATPLTSFVVMSLVGSGQANHPVVQQGVRFLLNSVRPDGSWPIDTNLATWVTTLAVNALAAAGDLGRLEKKESVRDWLLGQQFRERHPYTGAEPGGWGWTDLPGSVPDADDTPGAILALCHLDPESPRVQEAVNQGVRWLVDLQNRDGGWPTFCRGWGALPFDRSGPDLTAHALRALHISGSSHPRPVKKGLAYLARTQRANGSWLPLWFGNQFAPGDENPTYGTARVLAAYRDLGIIDSSPAQRGLDWLLSIQNPDGGWGGDVDICSTPEETALAVEILVDAGEKGREAANRGLHWLIEAVESGEAFQPAPIGFYFAKLWYFELLYPVVYTVSALGRARHRGFFDQII